MVSFEVQKVFKFEEVHFSLSFFFSFMDHSFGVVCKKSLLKIIKIFHLGFPF